MAEIAMAGILLCASYWDGRTGRIPNRLLLMGLAPVAWALAEIGAGEEALWRLAGMAAVFFFCWPLYLWGGLGAGDVKLFVLLAGVCGLFRLIPMAAVGFLAAGVYAVVQMVRDGSVFSLVYRLPSVFFSPEGRRDAARDGGTGRHKVILAPFITLGYLLVLGEGWWG